MRRPVYIISELYYPEESATGYLLTRIAEGLAQSREIRVLTGQPTYIGRGIRAPREEVRAGVRIHRCWGTTLDKNVLPARLMNALTITLTIFVRALIELRSGTIVMVVTNPPFLPLVAAVAARLRGARLVLLMHDLYPDALSAAGMAGEGSLVVWVLGWLNRWLYGAADRSVVLGRDMQRLIRARTPGPPSRVLYVPNWGDADSVHMQEKGCNTLRTALGLDDVFVVLYAGNMGRTHGLESIIDAAEMLVRSSSVHFLFVGGGAKRTWMEQQQKSRGLGNVHFHPNQPRARQTEFLNACDIGIISYAPGMSGVSVPSRMYNLFASGKPVIAVADADSELALVVREEGIGWVVPPASPEALVAAIREAAADGNRLLEMGLRARRAVETHYTLEKTIQGYTTVIKELGDAPAQ